MNRTPKNNPPESFMCIALIKPYSPLDRAWNSAKPAYCIYEHMKYSGVHQIRFGDGSWQDLNKKQLKDLILIPELDEKAISSIFD